MKRPTGVCEWAPQNAPVDAPLPQEVCARREPSLAPGGTGPRGFLASPRSRHCSVPVWVSLGCQPSATRPPARPSSTNPAPQAHPLRNTPEKLRYGLFLRLPDIVGTLPYSLLTAGKTSAQIVFFLKIYTYIYVCVHICTDIHTHPGLAIFHCHALQTLV